MSKSGNEKNMLKLALERERKQKLFDEVKSKVKYLDSVDMSTKIKGIPLWYILERYVVFSNGSIYSRRKTDFIKGNITGGGYRTFKFKYKDQKEKGILFSRLIAILYIPIPKIYLDIGISYDDLVVDHIDNNQRLNNDISNLQWLTPKENRLKSWTIDGNSNPNPNKGKNLPKEHRDKISTSKKVKIVQLSMAGEFIRVWDSATDARAELPNHPRKIWECCRGDRKSSGGFKWIYYDKWIEEQENKNELL